MTHPLGGTGVWTSALRYGDATEIAAAATELESLGYTAMWIPDVGGDVFGPIGNLLGATTTAVAATGILNLWLHTLIELWAWQQSHRQLCDRSQSPWDDADRRPSHADRRNALRRQSIQSEIQRVQKRRPLTPKIRALVRGLLRLVAN